MKVIAIACGYDNVSVREPGDVFDVREGAKASWYKKVEDDTKGPTPEAKAPKAPKEPKGPKGPKTPEGQEPDASSDLA